MAPGLRRSKLAVPPVEAKATKGTLNLDAKKNRIARSKEKPRRWKRWPLGSEGGLGETMQGWRSGARMAAFGKQMKRASLELQRCPSIKQPVTNNR